MTGAQLLRGSLASHPGIRSLSPAQRGLWFLENFHPNSSFYVVGLGLRLNGPLEVDALRRALADCERRQEALRARFVTLDGRPYQVFVAEPRAVLPLLDLSERPLPAALRELRARFEELAGRPFDLTAEAPLRAELVRVAPDHHALLLAIHHIVFDAWSSGLLLTDLAAGYLEMVRGDWRERPAPRPSFGEVAQRQAAAVTTGDAHDRALAHWRRVLSGAPRLELPTDLSRPGRLGFTGATAMVDVDAETGRAVRRLAGGLGVSPFTVLATGFNLLLAQWSGQTDLVIGVPLAGRADPATHELIGFFTNTLPLRVDLAGVRTFREAVRRHREPVLDLLSYQDMSFALLVDELGPAREANRNPYYDVTFQHLPAPEAGAHFAGLGMELLSNDWHTAQFDLSCDVFDAGDALRIQCEFSTELFSIGTIRRQLDRYVALLREAVADPDRLPHPGPAAAPGPGPYWTAPWLPGGLAGIVAAQAARSPDAVAVRSGDTSLSFRALDEAAGRLADALCARGVGAGDRVGLLLEPSPEAPAALLGVLRRGAAYVPVDPQTPPRRAAALLRAAGCRVVVCHDRTRATAAGLGATLVDAAAILGDAAAAILGDAAGPAAVTPDTPAYVMFTSGSTGAPKAVVVSHRAALALAAAAAEVYEIGQADVVAQLSSLAVDVSVEEYFASWYAGAGVVVAPAALAELEPLVRGYGVTVLNLPAARWHEWVRELTERGGRVPDGVRLVVAGSDRLNPDFVRAWHDGPGRRVRLLNAYGTTETAVSSTWYDTADYPVDARHTRAVPIGAAYPHARLYVLDERLDPVPDGVPGELCVGGPGVTLGYLGDPAGTAARFLPDPFSPAASGRMYRTGDRVRRLPTGALEFLGRADDQVKVRGYRIELGEVERAATGVPGVAEFVAAARTDGTGTVRLLGYVRPTDEWPAGRAAAGRRVDQWREVHDAELFNEAPAGTDPALNTGGWISSYTMAPIPATEMREWRDATVERLLAEPVGHVVEIGCGTGMILLPVAAHADSYLGTDISPRALAYVRTQLGRCGLAHGRVRLRSAPADDLTAVADLSPDLVILNSVSQYFPSADYLERVLTGLWCRVRPGGRLFIGDVRDLTTLRLFHLSVLAARAGSTVEPAALLHRAGERADTDSELCVDPRYFHALAADLPDLAAVDVQVKRGRADNEMNRFRYDVTLWRTPLPARPAPALPARDGSSLDPARLAALVDRLNGAGVALIGVPDARVAADLALAVGVDRVGAATAARAGDEGVHPDDVRDIAARAGYACAVRPAGRGRLDVMLVPEMGRPDLVAPDPAAAALDRAALTNDPLRAGRRREIAEALHARLREVLPAPMVPSRLVFVAEIPRTAGGKVDRVRLPDPPAQLDRAGLVPPRTGLERTLCTVWAQVLGLDAVGVRDNFFGIGGDSITWLQVVSRLARLGVHCEVRELFDHQTVEELAGAVEARQQGVGP